MASKPKHGLTEAQLAKLRLALEQKRDELRRKSKAYVDTATREGEELIEPMDVASHSAVVDELLDLADHERGLLAEVDGALARIEAGTYGLSEASGEPIPFARLSAVPWARNNVADE